MKQVTILALFIIIVLGCNQYETKKDGVYYIDWNEAHGRTERLIKDANPITFNTMKNDDYGKDDKSVFYNGRKIIGADPESFKLLEHGYAIDKTRAYYYGRMIENSSSIDFKIYDRRFSSDGKDVFFETKPLYVESLKEFKFLTINRLNNRWSTDGNHYWFNNYKVPSNDYGNIILLDNDFGLSRDNETVYYCDRDIRYNLKGERSLDTIDLETFEIVRGIKVRDKFGCINVFGSRKCRQ